MKKLVEQFPQLLFQEQNFESPEDTYRFAAQLVRALREYQIEVARIVNFNGIGYVSQNGRPTPANGAIILWKDADAAAGQSTHYLVATDDAGVTVTFKSVEVV